MKEHIITCPHCGEVVPLGEEKRAKHLQCNACGTKFSFVTVKCKWCGAADYTETGWGYRQYGRGGLVKKDVHRLRCRACGKIFNDPNTGWRPEDNAAVPARK